ncbi:MAG: fibronectin type III domain-containing protein [Hymenobacteraceae bacterium]|nr:fibronectin type III domain-containing protein [Hymenobacteraceae bacterium]
MKHTFSFGRVALAAMALTAPLAATAQTTIAAARAAAVNSTISVRGVVTNGAELGPIRYLQDGTGGIAAYSPAMLANVVPGDSILITGKMVDYNGLLEISPVTAVTVLAQGVAVTPVTVPAGQAASVYAEQYEGQLVRINGNTSLTTSAGAAVTTFAGNANYRLNSNTATAVRINSASTGANGLVGKPAPTAGFDLIGIMSQFDATGVAGYQLLPRLFEDFVLGNAPNIYSQVVVTNITTTSLDISFTTQNPGDARVEYGTSAGALTQTATNAGLGTEHTVSLTGLQPTTVYYVRVSSTNAIGTSTSRIVPVITQSLSSGRMRSLFTNPVDQSYAWPAGNLAVGVPTAMADSVATFIDQARQTLDIAIYNWNNTTILNAVIRAKVRGVRVRVISDGTAANASTQALPANGIPEIERNTMRGIMHNKIIIIDAEATDPNQPQIWTGGTNWTTGQLGIDRNAVVIVQDQSLARVYTMEFDEIWGSSTATPGTPKFGPLKTDNTPHYLKIGGHAVQSWFSPSDGVNTHLIETVNTAENDLHFATMLITRSDIAQAIKNRIQSQNILQCSEGLVNDTSASGTAPYRTLKNFMGARMQYFRFSAIMHHKYLLVDAGGSDPTTWVGSHNWSAGADSDNDENTLVIHDAVITNQFYQEFAQRIKDQNAGITLCQLRVLGLADATAGSTRLSATVYPNPTSGQFRVESAGALRGAVQVELRAASARRVLTTTTTAADDHSISLDADALPTGLYHLRVTSAAGTQLGRVSVVK